MRKYCILFTLFFLFFFGTMSFEFSDENVNVNRSFRKCKTCACDEGQDIKNLTNWKGHLKSQCEFKCAFECDQLLELQINRTEGNTTRTDENNDQVKSQNVRKALGWRTLISLLFIVTIFAY